MKWTRRKLTAFVYLTLFATSAVAVYCPPQYQENWVEPIFSSATSSLEASIQAVDTMLSTQLQQQTERMTSAIAVMTKQKALTANQIAESSRTSMMATSDALRAVSQAERVKRARFEYGGEFGQGYQPCLVQTQRTLFVGREAEMATERRDAVMQEIMAAPGVYSDPQTAQSNLASAHRAAFCTAAEVASGLCAGVGAYPAADVNAATMFSSAMESDPFNEAKVAFVNNVVGLPDPPVPAGAGRSPAAQAYMLAKQQKDALVSPALTSLKEIQLDYTGAATSHLGTDIPLAQRLKSEVDRYLGNSDEFQRWNQVLSGQTERGLLVELLKVKSLDLVMLEKHYRQYERMEAHLSVLVAGGARVQAAKAGAAAEAAQRAELRRAVQ